MTAIPEVNYVGLPDVTEADRIANLDGVRNGQKPPHLPAHAEIARELEKIRAGWSKAEALRRKHFVLNTAGPLLTPMPYCERGKDRREKSYRKDDWKCIGY